jgi:DNA-binding transcriptional ArsR family regulator
MTVFEALADRNRVRIMDSLAAGERSVGELVGEFELTQPAVSQHLRVLKEAGLVVSRAEAQKRIYRVSGEGLRDIDAWLTKYRKFWATELDALEQHLDANP